MRIYLDVSCLVRPTDDQGQVRIRLETEAIALILEKAELGDWLHLGSEMVVMEISACADMEKRRRGVALLPDVDNIVALTESIWSRAAACEAMGFKPADAVHIAAAENAEADVLLTCDDRMLRSGKRNRGQLRVTIENPLSWLEEQSDDTDT